MYFKPKRPRPRSSTRSTPLPVPTRSSAKRKKPPSKRCEFCLLLDPFEEQLHPPTTFVHRSDGQRRQHRVVGQKNQSFSRILILEPDTPQMLRVIPDCVVTVETNGLVAHNTGTSIGRCRINPPGVQSSFGSSNEKGAGPVQPEKPVEIQISPIHTVPSRKEPNTNRWLSNPARRP